MKHILPFIALAASGAIVASAGAYAAEADAPQPVFQQTALVGPSLGAGPADAQRDVIDPPSSVDPGMTLDPPQTGAKMPIIRPPGTISGGRLILPR